jgi:uncharacterized iron-regulated membrane protein
MALSQRSLKAWCFVHKWTSLVATLFLLLLCVTGLPLIFHEEIDALTRPMVSPAEAGNHSRAAASASAIMRDAVAANPGTVPLYLSWDDAAGLSTVYGTVAPAVDAPETAMRFPAYDAVTGARFDAPPIDEGVMAFLLELHAHLLLGLPGQMVLGLVALVFLAAIVSGVVVYAPFMRRLAFGTVRHDRSRRVRWLDTHNLTGVVTTAWVSVVALTGFILAMETPITYLWQRDQLAELAAPYAHEPVPASLVPIDAAIATARRAAPDAGLSFVAWPGTMFSSRHHYLVALKGTTPLTEKLVRVALVDAATGELTALRNTPWYVTAAFLSVPLHFGDYGHWPLKLIWALLDLIVIAVLVSGLILWLRRPSSPEELPA